MDGEAVTQRMWNRSFRGQGLEVTEIGYLWAPHAGGHEMPGWGVLLTMPILI